MRRAFAVAVIALCSAGPATAVPAAFSADYSISAAGVTIGTTRWRLSRDGADGYLFASHSEPKGLFALVRDDVIDESSRGLRGPDGALEPERYEYHRTGRKPREIQVDFDWERNRARVSTASGHWNLDLPDGTVDKLVYMVALMRDLAAGDRAPGYDVADGGKLKRYQFQVVGEETLTTSLGELRTLRVKRERMTERATTLWSAPALDYLPVRIEHRERDGTVITFELVGLEGLEARR